MQYILEAENITFTYPDGTRALNNLTLKIPRGLKTAFLGPNGAGKTTFFLHLNGVNKPDSGSIYFKGQHLDYSKKLLKKLRKEVGIVFQQPDSQLFSGSVFQDVSFGPLNLDWPEEKVRLKVKEVLEQTGIWDLRDKPVHFLSQGQKKRAAVAGILSMEPEVIILDEPAAGLEPFYAIRIMELLHQLNRTGTTIIFSSHDSNEVLAWADYVFVMKEGRIVIEGTPQEVFRMQGLYKEKLIQKPWVLEVYDSLKNAGKLGPDVPEPRERGELLKILEEVQN